MVHAFTQLFIFFLSALLAIAVSMQIIKHNRLIWGKTHRIHSKILNKARTIRVYLPADYNKSASNNQLYPVVYLFDGDAYCASVMGMLKQLREEATGSAYPEMIVVAVGNPDRASDFTPTNSLIGPDRNKLDMLKNSGGSEKFIAFVEKELIPYIESGYPALPYKTIIGHSLGGLAVMNILIHQTKMFDAYVAIEPSMWWDDKKVLDEARMKFKEKNFSGIAFFLGIANTMPAGMDFQQATQDTADSTNHVRSILELIDILGHNPGNGLNWQYKYYPDKNHGSVALPGIYDALRFLFDSNGFNPTGTFAGR